MLERSCMSHAINLVDPHGHYYNRLVVRPLDGHVDFVSVSLHNPGGGGAIGGGLTCIFH